MWKLQIWLYTVVDWIPQTNDGNKAEADEASVVRQKAPVRMDRLNKPLPPAITRTCNQVRAESLHLYYKNSQFECWRPFPGRDWMFSILVEWLTSLGSQKTMWLNDLVLLYKQESELEYDAEEGLAELGILVRPGVISNKREVTEYEMSYEQMGLPRRFGAKRRGGR